MASQAFLIFSGFNLRAVVAFCRALEKDHRLFRIIACTPSDSIFQTSWRRKVAAIRQQQTLDPAEIEQCIRQATAATGIKIWCIAPSSEFLVRWCLNQRELLASLGCNLPLPNHATYLQISDKRPFAQLCRTRDLPVPREGDTLESVGLPCVAKPVVNVTAEGDSLYPWLLRDAADVASFRGHARAGDYFFQEWVTGESVYLLLYLSSQGQAVRYSQRNLAQQPDGKSVVLAESAEFHHTSVARDWENAVRSVGFHGIIMVELRLRPDGVAVLIEANPRLWGPLQLVVDHCPELLETYFDDLLGVQTRPSPTPRSTRKAIYLWWGGARQAWRSGKVLTWHVPPPRHPRWTLARRLWADIYLRRDTLLWFWLE